MASEKHDGQNYVNTAEEEKIVSLAREAFDDSLLEIDGETLSRLRQARSAALQQLEHKTTWLGLTKNQWIPAGGFALAATLIVGIWIAQPKNEIEPIHSPSLANNRANGPENNATHTNEEDEIFAANEVWDEDEEMLDELDFITWLALDEKSAG